MKKTIFWIVLAIAAALGVLHLAQRQVAVVWPALAVHPQVSSALQQSMDDQKHLARLDPTRSREYRRRFDEIRALHNRLEIVSSGQEDIVRNQERIVFAVVAAVLLVIAVTTLMRRRREVARLAADRRRLRYLENLSSWQEAARRHAHEIRTPLTAAQLELDRLGTEVSHRHPEARSLVDERRRAIGEDLERLRRFTQQFTSFAAIGQPKLARTDLHALLRELCETYATAWPMTLNLEQGAQPCPVAADRAMLRQVLVNLCANSARANATRTTFRLSRAGDTAQVKVADDGSGIAEEVRSRLFQPYVTTQRIGEGMGLGLSISKKIMLDQGGDLELVSTSERGTTFALTLPCSGDASPK